MVDPYHAARSEVHSCLQNNGPSVYFHFHLRSAAVTTALCISLYGQSLLLGAVIINMRKWVVLFEKGHFEQLDLFPACHGEHSILKFCAFYPPKQWHEIDNGAVIIRLSDIEILSELNNYVPLFSTSSKSSLFGFYLEHDCRLCCEPEMPRRDSITEIEDVPCWCTGLPAYVSQWQASDSGTEQRLSCGSMLRILFGSLNIIVCMVSWHTLKQITELMIKAQHTWNDWMSTRQKTVCSLLLSPDQRVVHHVVQTESVAEKIVATVANQYWSAFWEQLHILSIYVRFRVTPSTKELNLWSSQVDVTHVRKSHSQYQ